jgi:hypothetical protein
VWLIAHLQQGGMETPPLELLVDSVEALVDVSTAEPSPDGC